MVELAAALDESELEEEEYSELFIEAWEDAVEKAMEERVSSQGEERAVEGYMAFFGLSVAWVDANGTDGRFVQSAVIQEVSEGIVPKWQEVDIRLAFELMKSEEIVWVLTNLD